MSGATTVYGATSIGGAITATSTLNVTGLTTLGNASTTQLSIAGNLWLNGFATTTSLGNINGQGILTMLGTGTSTFSGGIQSTALNITSATASSTFANGIILSKGCFLMPDGTCAGAGGGSGTINSGTTGQFPYYAGSGTTLTATSSLFLSSNQNLGIGTTTPNWLLQVAGTRPFFTLSDTGAGTDNKHWFMSSQGGNFYVGTSSDAYATSTYLTITNGGNVGIGTAAVSGKLDVRGGAVNIQTSAGGSNNNALSSGELYVQGDLEVDGTVYLSDSSVGGYGMNLSLSNTGSSNVSSFTLSQSMGNSVGTNMGINLTTTANTSGTGGAGLVRGNLDGTQAGSGSHFLLDLRSGGNTKFYVAANGRVGIGTTTPNWLLQVAETRPFITLSDTGAAANNKHWFLSSQGGNFYIGTSSDSYATSTSNLLNLISSNYSVGIGTTSPTEQLSVSGRLFVGGTGTSTIENNLYVMGTLRSTVSYVGDLIFSNNFRFIESQPNEKIQSLFLNNQYGENIFKINEKGQVVVKEIEAESIKSKKGSFEEGNFNSKLQIGSPQNRTGITIYDRKTGEPVCVYSENNVLKSSKGECK